MLGGREFQITLTRRLNEVEPGHLKMRFSPPLTFRNPRQMRVKLQNATFPNTVYNITEAKGNNLMCLDVLLPDMDEWTRLECKLKDGLYSMEQLMWVFFEMQKEANLVDFVEDPLTHVQSVYVFPVHWIVDESNTQSTFILRKTTKIEKVRLQMNTWGNLATQLGFSDKSDNSVARVVDTAGDFFNLSISSITPNRLFDDVARFSILCPFVTSSYGTDTSSIVLYSDILTGATNTLTSYPTNGVLTPSLPLETDSIGDLDLYIVHDLTGAYINFHEEEYYITLVFIKEEGMSFSSFI